MAYSVVQAKGARRSSTATTQALAFTSNVVAGNRVLVAHGWNSNTGTASVADGQGTTYTAITGALVNGGFFTVSIQAFISDPLASSGALTVTATAPSTAVGILFLREVSGLDAAPSEGAGGGGGVDASTSAATTVTLTTSQADDLVAYFEIVNVPAASQAGYTVDISVGDGISASAIKNTPISAGSVVVSDTSSGGGSFIAVALKASGGIVTAAPVLAPAFNAIPFVGGVLSP